MTITSRPPRTIKPSSPNPKANKKGSIAAKNITKETAQDAVASSQIRLKKREKICANPECGQPFIPVNVRQTKCKDCIKIANKVAQKATKDKILQKQAEKEEEENRRQKEIHQAALEAAKEAAKQSAILPIPEEKSTTLHDNLKLVNVRCRLEKDFPGECPHGGVFQCTWGKYQQGQAYCDRECHKLHKRLKSKAYQEEQEAKRQGRVPAEVVEIDYEPHPAQKEFHNSPARFKILTAGIRFGKDRACLMEGIAKLAEMLSENRPTSLVPRVHMWIVAPNFPLTRQIWRELKYFFPAHWIVNKNEAEHRIETVGDGLIEIKSGHDPDSLVSTGIDLVILSEFSRFTKKDEVWSYIRGRISSPGRGPGGKGGLVLINGTPKGRDLYYTMFGWGQDPNMSDWQSWHFPTLANPHMNPEEVEDAKKVMPARLFQQEYEAMFLTDGGDVFLNIDDISKGDIREPEKGVAFIGSWDPAEKGDFSCFTIINDRGEQVFLRRWTGVPYSIQINEVEYYCKKYNHAPVHIDCTAAGSSTLVQALIQRGVDAIEATFSNVLKAQWVSHFAILCENKEIILLDPSTGNDAKAQMEELKSYTYSYTSTGKISYHHLPGQHDDCIDALLLAYKEYHTTVQTLPFMGLLMGAKRKPA